MNPPCNNMLDDSTGCALGESNCRCYPPEWKKPTVQQQLDAALAENEKLKEALAQEMQTEQGEYCSVCGFHDIECGGHSDEDYACAALSNRSE